MSIQGRYDSKNTEFSHDIRFESDSRSSVYEHAPVESNGSPQLKPVRCAPICLSECL